MGNLQNKPKIELLHQCRIVDVDIRIPDFINIDYEGYFYSSGIIQFDLLSHQGNKITLFGYFHHKYYENQKVLAIHCQKKDIDPMSLKGLTILNVTKQEKGVYFFKSKKYYLTMDNDKTYEMLFSQVKIKDSIDKFNKSNMRQMKIAK